MSSIGAVQTGRKEPKERTVGEKFKELSSATLTGNDTAVT